MSDIIINVIYGALGCVLYEMMTLTHPFIGHNINELKYRIFGGKYNYIVLNNYSSELKQLVSLLLVVNPINRISIFDILNKSYIKSRIQSMNFYSTE